MQLMGARMADVQKDFLELLELFNQHKVKYCIVGAYAVAFYAVPRYTKDLDILIDPNVENGERIAKALDEFGLGGLHLQSSDFAKKGTTIQLGYEPVRIDILTEIGGCSTGKIWRNLKKGSFGSARVNYIGLKELIQNKQSVGRYQDKADAQVLIAYAKKK